MSRLEDLQPNAAVRGILPDARQACIAGVARVYAGLRGRTQQGCRVATSQARGGMSYVVTPGGANS